MLTSALQASLVGLIATLHDHRRAQTAERVQRALVSFEQSVGRLGSRSTRATTGSAA